MADPRAKSLAEFIAPFRVAPGSKVVLAKDFDPAYKAGVKNKKAAEELLQRGVEILAEYQDRLAAQDTYGVLVVLQALDAAGKDGTIRHVMSGVNPQGVAVHSFKVPSTEELDHDYLWRYAQRLPERGAIGIFNRSHYEEVLVVRVHPEILDHQKLPKIARRGDIWKRRYDEINHWERYLTDQGFRIVKIFLNLSKEEQRRRFLSRIDEREKNWKFSAADAQERGYWDVYQKAFSEMLSHTSTEWAPWYVLPADHKWFARISAAAVITDTLIRIDPRYPTIGDEQRQALEAERAALEAETPKGVAPDPVAEKLARDATAADAKGGKKAGNGAAKHGRGDTGHGNGDAKHGKGDGKQGGEG
jgi:PPK2 family polyphosphate:nucleotide phosphotransferase